MFTIIARDFSATVPFEFTPERQQKVYGHKLNASETLRLARVLWQSCDAVTIFCGKRYLSLGGED